MKDILKFTSYEAYEKALNQSLKSKAKNVLNKYIPTSEAKPIKKTKASKAATQVEEILEWDREKLIKNLLWGQKSIIKSYCYSPTGWIALIEPKANLGLQYGILLPDGVTTLIPVDKNKDPILDYQEYSNMKSLPISVNWCLDKIKKHAAIASFLPSLP